MSTSTQVNDMLRNARAILADAGDNMHLLGHALSQFHSALEEHFRYTLERNSRVPEETRIGLRNTKDINRVQLLELMMSYEGLSTTDAGIIRRYNYIRNRIQHDNEIYQGTREEVERYARLVERVITGELPSFEQAEIPNELFEAQIAMLGIPTPAKQQPDPAAQAPATNRETVAAADTDRSSAASRPSRPATAHEHATRRKQVQPRRQNEGAPVGDWFMYALIALIIIAVIWRLLSTY
jgi:hypothetical protein